MTNLVTGATGLLGAALVERLLAQGGSTVRCFVRPTSDLTELEAIRSRYPWAKLEYVSGSLLASDDLRRAVEGIDTVYHLAAGMRGLPATMFLYTVVASKHLIDAVESRGLRVVLVSTIGVYGTSHLAADRVVDEECGLEEFPEKRNPYFHSKIWQERLFWEAAGRRALDLVVLRPGIFYSKRYLPLPGRAGLRLGRLLLQLGGENMLPLCHIDNCAAGTILAGESPRASNQAYNLVDDDPVSVREYVNAYRRSVESLVSIPLSFTKTMLLSQMVERYHAFSKGQIPRALSRYESAAMWKGHRFDNRKIKSLGWEQIVSTPQAMHEAFSACIPQTESQRPVRQILRGVN